MRERPLVIDLFCGLGGWTRGFLAEGFDCVGFDIERHRYGDKRYPSQLVLQDVLTLHGSQFRDAAAIVASPPCQAYSWMAMPWKLGKAKAAAIRKDVSGVMMANLTALFDACFRIQHEASQVAGHHIPMVVENVRGAQPWVGRAAWNYGSFYLRGDVPALMPITMRVVKSDLESWRDPGFGHGRLGRKNDGRKVPGMNFHDYEKTGKPGRSFQSAAVDSIGGNNDVERRVNGGDEPTGDPNRVPVGIHDYTGARTANGVLSVLAKGDTFGWSKDTPLRDCNSKSQRRKEASAAIAEIPLDLAQHIARCFQPSDLRNHVERPSHCAVP